MTVSPLPCLTLCDKEMLFPSSCSSIFQTAASAPQMILLLFVLSFHPPCHQWRRMDWKKQEKWTPRWKQSMNKVGNGRLRTWKCWLEWRRWPPEEKLLIAFSVSYGSFSSVCMSGDQEEEWRRDAWIWRRIICWQLAGIDNPWIVPSMYPTNPSMYPCIHPCIYVSIQSLSVVHSPIQKSMLYPT